MRHNNSSAVLAVAILSLFAIPFIAAPKAIKPSLPQPQTAVPQTKIAKSRAKIDMNNLTKDQSAEGGMWRTDGTFSPTFMLMNGLANASMKVTPVLYMADGTEYDLPQVQLDPSGVAMINIVSALREAPSNIQGHISTFGSAATRFQWPWPVVGAAILNRDQVRSLVYQTHLQTNANVTHDPTANQSAQVMQSTWWKQEPDVTGFLSLTNTSLAPISATVKLTDGSAQHFATQQVSLPSHATAWVDLSQLWTQLPSGVTAGGMDIAFTGPQGAISTSGGLQDADKGYSQMLHFKEAMQMATATTPTPKANAPVTANSVTAPSAMASTTTVMNLSQPQTTTLDSTGIMMGTQDADMQFPKGTTFAPYMVLRNTTANPMPVQLAVNTMSGSDPKDAPLGTVTLSAFESRQVDMKSLLAAASLSKFNGYINVSTTFAGGLGDVLAETGSIDPTFNYVFEVPAHIEQETGSRIFNYWNTNGDTDSMFTLWNYSDSVQDVVLTFNHQEGKYELPVHLAPHASMTMSVGKLVHGGVPDRNGRVIPASIVQGSAKISGLHNNREKIKVAVFGGTFNARTGTCYYMCQDCDGVISNANTPTDVTLVIFSGGAGIDCTVTYYDGTTEDVTGEVDLTSSNGLIATAGFGSVEPGSVAGSVSVTGYQNFPGIGYDDQEYSCEGCQTYGAGFYVAVTVNNPPSNHPVITSLSDGCIAQGATIPSFTINGSGFDQPTPTVNLPSGVTAPSGITSFTGSQIILSITASGSATLTSGSPVTVTVNGHTSNADQLLKVGTSCP